MSWVRGRETDQSTSPKTVLRSFSASASRWSWSRNPSGKLAKSSSDICRVIPSLFLGRTVSYCRRLILRITQGLFVRIRG